MRFGRVYITRNPNLKLVSDSGDAGYRRATATWLPWVWWLSEVYPLNLILRETRGTL